LTSSLAENDRMRAALQRMLDSMPCGVLVLDNDEHVVMINPEGRRLLRIGNERVNSLCDLSRLSQIEFALLQRGSDDRVDSEVCIESSDGKRWLAIRNRKLNSRLCTAPLQIQRENCKPFGSCGISPLKSG